MFRRYLAVIFMKHSQECSRKSVDSTFYSNEAQIRSNMAPMAAILFFTLSSSSMEPHDGLACMIFGVYVPSLDAVQICSFCSIPILNMATRRPFWIQNVGQKSKFSKYGQVACQIEEHNENNSDLFISFHSDLKYGCQATILDLICKSCVNI